VGYQGAARFTIGPQPSTCDAVRSRHVLALPLFCLALSVSDATAALRVRAGLAPVSPPGRRAAAGGEAGTSQAPPESSTQRDIARGTRLLERGAVEDAVTLARELVRREPDNADAQLLLGRALALVPEPANAVAAIGRAIDLQPDRADGHYTLGTVLARFGDLDAARVSFERAIEKAPAMAEAHASLGLLLAQRRELPQAKRHLTRAIELYGETSPAAFPHYVLAQALREEQDLEQALHHLTEAVALRPDYAEAYSSLGAIRTARLDHAGAADAFGAAVRLLPDSAEARAGLGAAYLQLEQPAKAIPHLETAVRLRPADRTARYHLCRSYSLAARAVEAKACYGALSKQMADERGESDVEAARLNREGLALEVAGDLPAALERYRAAVALSPYATVLRRNLALAYCRLGRWDEGIAELRKVIDANPDDQDAIRALYVATEQSRRARQ
jgi:tetratricopeptide (TPR) repeat protein